MKVQIDELMNYLALLVAALVPMVIGYLWYGPLFGKTWMNSTGMTEAKMKSANMPMIFGFSFLLALILAFAISILCVHDNMVDGALFYATDKTMIPTPGSEEASWLAYYYENLAPDNYNFKHGAFHGGLFGLLLFLPVIGNIALYEQKGWKYVAINVGYWVLCAVIMGGILGAWR